jgi:hypothetical protein
MRNATFAVFNTPIHLASTWLFGNGYIAHRGFGGVPSAVEGWGRGIPTAYNVRSLRELFPILEPARHSAFL